MAQRFLQKAGFTVVARNYRTSTGSGEVDLIAWEHGSVVFVEVKSRSSEEFGPPDRAVDAGKRYRLAKAALDYVRRADIDPAKVRFDVVNIVFGRPPVITHHRGAFTIQSVFSPQ